MEGNTFVLTFDNDKKTTCEVVETKTDELVCLTSRFDAFFDKDKTVSMSVVINDLTIDNSFTFKTKSDI